MKTKKMFDEQQAMMMALEVYCSLQAAEIMKCTFYLRIQDF